MVYPAWLLRAIPLIVKGVLKLLVNVNVSGSIEAD
jgi:hypothetical protein